MSVQGKPNNMKNSTPKNTSRNKPVGNFYPIVKRLSKYMFVYKKTVILIAAGFFLSTVLSLTPSWLIKTTLDEYLLPSKIRYLWIIALAMIGAGVLQGSIDFLTRFFAESKGQKIVYTVRQQVYGQLMKQSFSYFDQARTGDIMSRITADAETLQGFFGFASIQIISNCMFIIGILAVMFFWNIKLALLYIIMLPFIVSGIYMYAFKVRPALAKTRRILGNLTVILQEQLQGIQVIKILGSEKQVFKNFNKMNQKYYQVNLEAGRIRSYWMPYVFVFIGLGTGLVVWYGGREVIAGGISLGTLAGFSTYIGMMMRPIRQTGMLVSQVLTSAAAAERIFAVLDARPEVEDEPGAIEMADIKGEVSYENVSFSYTKNASLLQNITFKAKPGETIAIVGPTGAGKTTLVHLLPRFYNVDSGLIKIDGRDITGFTAASLRQQIGIVMQHTFLFNVSIRENIAFGKTGAGLEEVRHAAQTAQVDDFIMSLPRKYDTIVGERGVKLSGGQRQRIAIARMLLVNPRILILDEPTASVDAETDEKIQTAVNNLCKDRTVFIIAHRLWTLKKADRILVLDSGRIVQYGIHQELIDQPGLYQEIYNLQKEGENISTDGKNINLGRR